MTGYLNQWQEHLSKHFSELAAKRRNHPGAPPIFALEHSLDGPEIKDLTKAIRAHIRSHAPSPLHRLPWIVYAAEIGYDFSGSEYWQTFEAKTPGWKIHGERKWMQRSYWWFHEEYGGVRPSGRWADHFTIICWPITHAVLPKDLQKQLAQALFEVRHSFSQDVLKDPTELGELISARSWSMTQRFRNFLQQADLVGQIAAALLLEGQNGTEGFLDSRTISRITLDLNHERQRREWLMQARNTAKERLRVIGLARASKRKNVPRNKEEARAVVQELGIEPRLFLQPEDTDGASWCVCLEIPNLSSLAERFPNASNVLKNSRCHVVGREGTPIARSGFLYNSRRLILSQWPRSDESLLEFESSHPDLEFLLKTECLLSPGPRWLFRIASDGMAYESKGLTVRPGQRYLVLDPRVSVTDGLAKPIDLACHGIQGIIIDLPKALGPRDETAIQALGLAQSKSVQVWPAGLAPLSWDGEGYGEWVVDEHPILGIQCDHSLDSISVSLDNSVIPKMELTDMVPGEPQFVQLPTLPIGHHTIRIDYTASEAKNPKSLGYLNVLMRVGAMQPWPHGISSAGPLSVRVDPPAPALEQLWDGQVQLDILGPSGRSVICRMSLLDKDEKRLANPIERRLTLPIEASDWKSKFNSIFRENKAVQNKYDAAHKCCLELNGGELGSFALYCEREFTPLRWIVLRMRDGTVNVRLIDDSGIEDKPQVFHSSYRNPLSAIRLENSDEYQVDAPGGLFLARQNEFSAGIIVGMRNLRSLSELAVSPEFPNPSRSLSYIMNGLMKVCSWSMAKSSGDIVTFTRRQKIVKAAIRHLTGLIAGKHWTEAEAEYSEGDSSDHSILLRAVSRSANERSFASTLESHLDEITSASTRRRIWLLANAAIDHRAIGNGTGNKSATQNHTWMTELVLRVCSDPRVIQRYAASEFREGINRLLELSILVRAARYLILATAENSAQIGDEVYPGWEWQ